MHCPWKEKKFYFEFISIVETCKVVSNEKWSSADLFWKKKQISPSCIFIHSLCFKMLRCQNVCK